MFSLFRYYYLLGQNPSQLNATSIRLPAVEWDVTTDSIVLALVVVETTQMVGLGMEFVQLAPPDIIVRRALTDIYGALIP